MSDFAKFVLFWLALLLASLLLATGILPARADVAVTYQNCKHEAQFAAFVKTIPKIYLSATSTHWVVVEYPAAKWPLACKVYGATGNPGTFQGVTFLAVHIILVEDAGDADPDTAALGTFIHECGHALIWPAISDIRLPEYRDSLDAVYQHEYDVLGRDSLPSDAAVQEAWCEELRHTQTPGDTQASSWAQDYFSRLFSPFSTAPPPTPMPTSYITPQVDDVPPAQ